MDLDIFGLFTVNILYVMIGLIVVTLAALIISIIAICKLGGMKRKYRIFMNGKDAESMEDAILSKFAEIDIVKKEHKQHGADIKKIFDNLEYTFQKIGINKYDAFHEMGGKLSFALALLDARNNGYLINAIHSREGCYTYIKEIVNGESFIDLSADEKIALDEAIAGKGAVELGDVINKEINSIH